MSTPYISQISTFAFNFAPKGWALCNGQLLPISQNQALFALIGTTYGGNGSTTFALPNLQGVAPLHFGTGTGLPSYSLGQAGGEASHTLTTAEMPAHIHPIVANGAAAAIANPVGAFPAVTSQNVYSTTPTNTVAMASTSSGSSQTHPNQQPYLVLNFCIALTGIFPSRN